MSKPYCLWWNKPPIGFGKRNADESLCLNPSCRCIHADIPEEDLDAAKEVKIYLMEREKAKQSGGGTNGKGKDGGKGWYKGGKGKDGGKDWHKGGDSGKGSPADANGQGNDALGCRFLGTICQRQVTVSLRRYGWQKSWNGLSGQLERW